MNRAEPDLRARARGALLGLAAAASRSSPPAGAHTALARELALELLEAAPEPDLRRLAWRWIAWMERDGRGLDAWTRTALGHIRTHDSPPGGSSGDPGAGAIARALPVALATLASPKNLVGGSYHTAILTHPDERSAWGAVAVNVAAARFLQGKRDFIPDVIEALRNNAAPADLLDAARRVPLMKREELDAEGGGAVVAVRVVEAALWMAYHEPNFERGLGWLAGLRPEVAPAVVVAGGLLGARDGECAIPAAWLAAVPEGEQLGVVAEMLVGKGKGEMKERLNDGMTE